MFFSPLTSLLLPFIAKTLNTAIASDPRALARLAAWPKRVVSLTLTDLSVTVYLVFTESGLQLCKDSDEEVDLQLQTSMQTMIKKGIVEGKDQRAFFHIQGDSEFALELQQFFGNLQIDWEGLLAECVGDVCARQCSRAAQATRHRIKDSYKQLRNHVFDYLQEESGHFPAAEAVEDFYQDLFELRLAVDRVEARVNRLLGRTV